MENPPPSQSNKNSPFKRIVIIGAIISLIAIFASAPEPTETKTITPAANTQSTAPADEPGQSSETTANPTPVAPPTPAPVPQPVAAPAPTPVPAPAPAPRSDCDPNYAGGCVPNVGYDLDCGDIGFTVTVVGSDPHRFDRDKDGIGCE